MARRSTAIRVQRAAERYSTRVDGIESWHCFSAGAHYDASNVSFGPLIGFDEHVLSPGAGFDEHAHTGVTIVSLVLSGVLAHNGTAVTPSEALVQVVGDGITHTERNASDSEPLRLLQMTLLDERTVVTPSTALVPLPVHAPGGLLSLVTDQVLTEGPTFCFCVNGRFLVDPKEALGPGDSLRAEDPLAISGTGELLVWTLPPFRQPVLPRTKPTRRRLGIFPASRS